MSFSSKIGISDWRGEIPTPGIHAHLDVGSANYGPEVSTPNYQQLAHLETDTDGRVAHAVLFSVAEAVFQSLPTGTTGVIFYLNDISPKGLDRAAINLARHIEEKGLNCGRIVRIVKIAADVFTCRLPPVDSATFIHPFYTYIPRLVKDPPNRERDQAFRLLYKLAVSSKTGVVVKEVNVVERDAKEVLSALESPIVIDGLVLVRDPSAELLPPYRFPSGLVLGNPSIGYRACAKVG